MRLYKIIIIQVRSLDYHNSRRKIDTFDKMQEYQLAEALAYLRQSKALPALFDMTLLEEGSVRYVCSSFVLGNRKMLKNFFNKEEEICFNYQDISDENAKEIANALRRSTSLKEIALTGNKISDEGAKAIADALRENTSLKQIYLKDNRISDEGAKAFAGALRENTILERIYLDQNQISDRGAKAIADMIRANTSLQIIDLSENQISHEGAKAISDALEVNTSLKFMLLNDNGMSDHVAKEMEYKVLFTKNVRCAMMIQNHNSLTSMLDLCLDMFND